MVRRSCVISALDLSELGEVVGRVSAIGYTGQSQVHAIQALDQNGEIAARERTFDGADELGEQMLLRGEFGQRRRRSMKVTVVGHLVVVAGDVAGKPEQPCQLLLLRGGNLECGSAGRAGKETPGVGGGAETGRFGAVEETGVVVRGEAKG